MYVQSQESERSCISVRDIDCDYFYNFDIWFLNCFDSVGFFVFFVLLKNTRLFLDILFKYSTLYSAFYVILGFEYHRFFFYFNIYIFWNLMINKIYQLVNKFLFSMHYQYMHAASRHSTLDCIRLQLNSLLVFIFIFDIYISHWKHFRFKNQSLITNCFFFFCISYFVLILLDLCISNIHFPSHFRLGFKMFIKHNKLFINLYWCNVFCIFRYWKESYLP